MRQRLMWFALLATAIVFSRTAYADSWQMQVGAETGNKAHQALAFLPNEIWIHAGDTITFSFSHSCPWLSLRSAGRCLLCVGQRQRYGSQC